MGSTDEYHLDILEHMVHMQTNTTPHLHLIRQQPEINLKMRPLLLDFLMDVTAKLGLRESTFPSTVNLIDRYCLTRIVKKQHYQLLGLTSLWISCKNHDSKSKIPSLLDLCKMCCNCYDKKLFLEMETHLLASLNWDVCAPTCDLFVEIFATLLESRNIVPGANGYLVHAIATYICELTQFYPNIYFNQLSSRFAIGALLTSLLICNVPLDLPTTLNFLNSVLSPECILNLADFHSMHRALLKVAKCPPPSLKAKYFSSDAQYTALMKQMINYVNENLLETPLTPKFQILHHRQSGLPHTPESNNISPKFPSDHAGSFSGQKCSPISQGLRRSGNNILPSPKYSPDNISVASFPPTANPVNFVKDMPYSLEAKKKALAEKRAYTAASMELCHKRQRTNPDSLFIIQNLHQYT